MAISSNTHNNFRHFQEDHMLLLSELQQYLDHWHVQPALTSTNLCYNTAWDPAIVLLWWKCCKFHRFSRTRSPNSLEPYSRARKTNWNTPVTQFLSKSKTISPIVTNVYASLLLTFILFFPHYLHHKLSSLAQAYLSGQHRRCGLIFRLQKHRQQ